MKVERKFITSIPDPDGRYGAYATKWLGWVDVPTVRDYEVLARVNLCHFEDMAEKAEASIGCYALTYGTKTHDYVVYVGYSENLAAEVKLRIRGWQRSKRMGDTSGEDSPWCMTAVYLNTAPQARDYEYGLIRFYAPSWNVRFSKQGRRGAPGF